jgi:rsbT co-antagonist protein RsbR
LPAEGVQQWNQNQSAEVVGLCWALLDALGLRTLETFQKSREEVIIRQQREIAELSTPVVKLWEGILALPLIRTLDSQRTQVITGSFMRRSMEMPRSPCRKR